MARTRRSAKAPLSPTKKLAGSREIQKHKSAKSTPKTSLPGMEKLTRPKRIQNHRKGPKSHTKEMYKVGSEDNFPTQTQPHEATGLPMTNDTEVQSSPVPPISLKRKIKGKKKSLKAAPGKKNNAAIGEEHNANGYDAADAEGNNTGDAEEHNTADAEEQVVEGSDLETFEVNSGLADSTVVVPLPTPATKRLEKAQPPLQLNRKSEGHVTKKMRRESQFDPSQIWPPAD